MTEEQPKKSQEQIQSFGYLFFKEPLVTLPKTVRSLVLLVSKIVWGSLGFVALLFCAIGLYALIQHGFIRHLSLSFLWLGILLMLYLIHHLVKSRKSWRNLNDLRKATNLSSLNINIAEYFEPESKDFLALAYAEAKNSREPLDLTLFRVLLNSSQTQDFLHHLELDPQKIKQQLVHQINAFKKDYELSQEPPQKSFEKIVTSSFTEAFRIGSRSVKLYHFLMALFSDPHPVLANLFLKYNIELEDARRVARWLRIKNNLVYRSKRPFKIKHKTMNRTFTAKPTKYLDSFSDDLTDLARHQLLSALVGHKEEYQAMLNILNQDARNNVLLVGPSGSGRQTIIGELARQITRDNVPKSLFDKRLVSLNPGNLLAGIKTPGALQERLQKVMDEIIASKNIILAIPQIHDLIQAIDNQAVSFMSFFGPVFESVDFPLVATIDEANYHQFIEKRGDLAGSFNIVKVQEITQEEAIYYLMRKALTLERKHHITIGHFAVKEAVELSDRYLKNLLLPSKAYDLMTQAIEEAKIQKKNFVSRDDIKASLSKSTGIPIQRASKKEGEALLDLEEEIHQRLIDQKPAVKAVSDVLRQARAGLERRTGPIGTFLFVGPTGVGKTELAKTLARVYFGGEERMLRFDMSEYQSADSIYRLIGTKQKGGFLTEKVKNQPFSLLLLDEFEKAHSDVLNLFLQVFEDGRVTDEIGNSVDFSNTIIITTSNAHAVLIQEKLQQGDSPEKISKLLRDKLTDIYRPELLNRFDDIIIFRSLTTDEIQQITQLKLKDLFERLEEEQSIKFSISQVALQKMAQLSYDPKNGARPVRRALSKHIKNLIANEILAGKLKKGDKYMVDLQNDKFVIKKR